MLHKAFEFFLDVVAPVGLVAIFFLAISVLLTAKRQPKQKARVPTAFDLNEAICNGSDRRLVSLLDRGISPESSFWGGIRLLHSACSQGNVSAVRILLDRGADPLAVSLTNQLPITYAIEHGHLTIVRELLGRGVPATICRPLFHSQGISLMNTAISNARLEIVNLLLDCGIDPRHATNDPLSVVENLLRLGHLPAQNTIDTAPYVELAGLIREYNCRLLQEGKAE